MVVVAHDGVGAQINGKYGTQQLDAIDDPLSTMLKVEAGYRIRTAQESSSYTTRDTVVVGCVINRDLAVSWFGHVISLDRTPVDEYGKWREFL